MPVNTETARLRRKVRKANPNVLAPRKMGRPTLYRPEHCALVESLGKQGKSRAEIASLLNIDRATLADWQATNPEFGRAFARAMMHSQAWWEAKAQQSLGKKVFQAQLWRYNMAGRFREDYAERGQGMSDGGLDLGGLVEALARGAVAGALEAKRPGDDAKPLDLVSEPVIKDRSGTENS